MNDHLTPWAGSYRTTQLLSGPSTFELSNAGHVAGLVNPPGNSKASYWAGGQRGAGPEEWRASAEKHIGIDAHPPLEPAPGSYVLDRVPASAAGERPVGAGVSGGTR